VNQKEFSTSIICKTFVEKFVTITLLLKESMVLLKKEKCNFIEQKLLKLILYIYTKIKKKIIMGAGRGGGIGPQSQ